MNERRRAVIVYTRQNKNMLSSFSDQSLVVCIVRETVHPCFIHIHATRVGSGDVK